MSIDGAVVATLRLVRGSTAPGAKAEAPAARLRRLMATCMVVCRRKICRAEGERAL